jgi:hypothetical protein
MSDNSFLVHGNIGDVFIKITNESEVQLIFGEDDESIYREVDWETHEIYKTAVQFALMLDSHIRNAKALDSLIVDSTTGSIPAELLNNDMGLPITVATVIPDDLDLNDIEINDLTEEESVNDNNTDLVKDNVIQFKRKNNEDE